MNTFSRTPSPGSIRSSAAAVLATLMIAFAPLSRAEASHSTVAERSLQAARSLLKLSCIAPYENRSLANPIIGLGKSAREALLPVLYDPASNELWPRHHTAFPTERSQNQTVAREIHLPAPTETRPPITESAVFDMVRPLAPELVFASLGLVLLELASKGTQRTRNG